MLASRIMFNLRKSSYQLQKGEMMNEAIVSDIVCSSPPPPSILTGLASSESGGKRVPDGADVELVELKSRWNLYISRV